MKKQMISDNDGDEAPTKAPAKRKGRVVGVSNHALKAAAEHVSAARMYRAAATKAKGAGNYNQAADHHRMAAESHMRAQQAKAKPYPRSAVRSFPSMI